MLEYDLAKANEEITRLKNELFDLSKEYNEVRKENKLLKIDVIDKYIAV